MRNVVNIIPKLYDLLLELLIDVIVNVSVNDRNI